MKAWRVHQWCEPEQMSFEDVTLPEPGEGRIRIRTHAAALNFFDILQIGGKYQIKPPFPFTPGAEVAGVVDAVGPGVTAFGPGDRVMAMVQQGGYGEQVVTDSARAFSIPGGMSFEEAAAVPIVYHTSYLALTKRTVVHPDEWLLVHAGASGVGMSAIQIGTALGARIIATASTEEKLAFAKAQGADHALSYADDSWVDEVKRITGKGADVIYDPVGGDVFDLSTKCLAPEGRLLVIGFASGRIPEIAANRILLKDISIVGVHWGFHVGNNPGYLAETHDALTNMYAAGQIKPIVAKASPLAEAPAALQDLAQRRTLGKAVLTID